MKDGIIFGRMFMNSWNWQIDSSLLENQQKHSISNELRLALREERIKATVKNRR
jgi:hypothetical protein